MRAYDWQKENVFQQKNIILISSLQKISAPHFSTTSFLMIFCFFLLKKRKKTYPIKTMQLRSGLGLFNREMFLLLRNSVYIYKSVYVKRMCITEIFFFLLVMIWGMLSTGKGSVFSLSIWNFLSILYYIQRGGICITMFN